MTQLLNNKTWTRRIAGGMPMTCFGGVLDDTVFGDVLFDHEAADVERLETLSALVESRAPSACDLPAKTSSIPLACIDEIGLPEDEAPFVAGRVRGKLVKIHIAASSIDEQLEIVDYLDSAMQTRRTTRRVTVREILSASLFTGFGVIFCGILINFFLIIDSGWDEYQGRGAALLPLFQNVVQVVGVIPLILIPAGIGIALCLRLAHQIGNRKQIPVLVVSGLLECNHDAGSNSNTALTGAGIA